MIILNGSTSDLEGKKVYCFFAIGGASMSFQSTTNPLLRHCSQESFMEDLKWCDSIYFSGGDTPKLLDALSKYDQKELHKLLSQKLIVATSAGISALAIGSANFDHMKYLDGIGFLPFCTIVHYVASKHFVVKELQKLYNNVPVLCVGDRDRIVLEL